nr:alpha-hydroxy acid oxidase [Sphingomonas sp. Y57]
MLARCHNIEDLRRQAARRLPTPIFDFLDGGAEDEATLRNNRMAFDREKLVPSCLRDVETVDTATTIFGQASALPLICAPTGASRLFHPAGEIAVARAAARAGVPYALSTGSTRSIEEVAAASDGAKIFQLYVYKDHGVNRELIERARAAGYGALCITVDVAVVGKRERDLRHGLSIPMRFTPAAVARFACSPRWLWGVRGGLGLGANLKTIGGAAGRGRGASTSWQLDPSLDWDGLADLAALWNGPFVVKGIMAADDARHALDAGATGIIISNHGGRQLDGAAAPIEVLPAIAQAVAGRADIVLDGGVRRGTHILKAIALGAKGVAIGRPYLYGLAAGGEAGVDRALAILHKELAVAMQLAGCPDLGAIDERLILRASPA